MAHLNSGWLGIHLFFFTKAQLITENQNGAATYKQADHTNISVKYVWKCFKIAGMAMVKRSIEWLLSTEDRKIVLFGKWEAKYHTTLNKHILKQNMTRRN